MGQAGVAAGTHNHAMVSRRPTYPFVPKSNAHLLPGHIWGIALRDGRFACGVVVAVPTAQEAPHYAINSRTFAAGLLDWVGDELPSPDTADDSQLLTWGFGHVKMIGENRGAIVGHRSPPVDRAGALSGVSHRVGGTVGLYCDGRMVGTATADEARDLPVIGTWGFGYIVAVAERVFVDHKSVVR
ncbi:hypothetical protein ACIBL3_00120 [Kribbella sp. NPDC050124]|uniref:hypothetical protein n=1 Tax=Kribbella sp. NPDC050124 TaxID=3364114 RepID=UPI0037B959A9